MNLSTNKKTFTFLLTFILCFNFLPLGAESSFKPPVLNSTDLAFNGPINAIVVDEKTGIVYLGGQFTQVGENTGSGVSLDIPTGKLQMAFPKVNGPVLSVISDGSKGWYIGGDFTSVGGIKRNCLAHVLSDETVDPNWNPNANNNVTALVKKRETIYIAGNFTKIGEKERGGLAAVGTDGNIQDWSPSVGGFVKALAIKGSIVYVGGDFNSIDEKERNNLAAIGTDGTLANWNPNVKGSVSSIAISNSIIYIGGNFTKIAKTKRNDLAAIGIDGVLKDWNPNVDGNVNALAIKDSTIYVGGSFNTIDSESRANFASFSILDKAN